MDSDADERVRAGSDGTQPTPEQRARFDWWMAVTVPLAVVDGAMARFRPHAPPLTGRDVACLAILEIEGAHLRHLIPDDRPDEDNFAMFRAFIAVHGAYFCEIDPKPLFADFALWREEVVALRAGQRTRPLTDREACVLRLSDEVVVAGRINPAGLDRSLRWAITSAEKRAAGRARARTRITEDELLTGLHEVAQMDLEGLAPWCGIREGRYILDKRALRDRLLPDYHPVVPPLRRTGSNEKVRASPRPDGPRDLRDVPAPAGPQQEIERLELFRELRGVLDRFRDRPGCVAAFGYLLGQERLGDDLEFPEIAPGGYSTEDEAAAACGVTREAVRHGRRLLDPEMARIISRRAC